VVAAAEPAVVQHEALDAHVGGGIGQRHQVGQAVVEVQAFPGVQVHRPRLHRATRPVQPAAQFGVEIGGQPVQAGGRAGGDQLRRVQRLTRQQPAFTGREPFAHLPLVEAVVQPFDRLLVAQAMEERLTLLTVDETLKGYGRFVRVV
jgi:hypothetical protein